MIIHRWRSLAAAATHTPWLIQAERALNEWLGHGSSNTFGTVRFDVIAWGDMSCSAAVRASPLRWGRGAPYPAASTAADIAPATAARSPSLVL